MKKTDIKNSRNKIDRIDKEIVKLFEERMAISEEIAEYKLQNGCTVRDEKREEELKKALALLVNDEVRDDIPTLYDTIISLSCRHQHEYIKNNAMIGLVGGKLSHSYSPQIHSMLTDYTYSLIELDETELEEYFTERKFTGINVTIPYKKRVLSYLDDISDTVKKIGAVNTVIKRSNGTLFGDNTDYYGFMHLMLKNKVPVKGKKCIILGNGGSAATVRAVLTDMDAGSIVTVSRTGEYNYENIHLNYDSQIIINTTPLGMYPDTGSAAIDLSRFTKCLFVVDLIYNPAKTKLLLDAEKLGIPYANGLTMLVAQAKRSAELFTGKEIDEEVIDGITEKLIENERNIVLIGMAGSGKTETGKVLAEIMQRKFIDTDKLIEERTGKTIPEIFDDDGEAAFRSTENKIIAEVGKESRLVIATGGGSILSKENVDAIKQNGVTVLLLQDLNKLATASRPLYKDKESIEKLYSERKPIYESTADISVTVQKNARLTAELIKKELQ